MKTKLTRTARATKTHSKTPTFVELVTARSSSLILAVYQRDHEHDESGHTIFRRTLPVNLGSEMTGRFFLVAGARFTLFRQAEHVSV